MANRFWIYILIFVLCQSLAAALLLPVRLAGWQVSYETMLVVPLIVANALAIAIYAFVHPAEVTWSATVAAVTPPTRRLTLAYILAAPAIIPLTNLLQENLLGFLPDFVGDQNLSVILDNPAGLLAVCLLGPLAEEMLFRGGIQCVLQRRRPQSLWPIVWSALLFGLVHANPVQIPAAVIIGLYLGFAYRQTHSMAAPVVIHIFNNSTAAILALFTSPDMTLTELTGGAAGTAILALACLFWAFLCLKNNFSLYNKV